MVCVPCATTSKKNGRAGAELNLSAQLARVPNLVVGCFCAVGCAVCDAKRKWPLFQAVWHALVD